MESVAALITVAAFLEVILNGLLIEFENFCPFSVSSVGLESRFLTKNVTPRGR